MNALAPVFIYEQLSRKRTSGSANGVCLTIDVSGFTAVTEDLMDHGKDGAEELSRLINDLFGNIVALVYSYQGFILSFAGDALTALFPAEDARYACSAAVAIRDLIRNKRRVETRFGLYRISVRIGLGMGPFTWGIVGNDVRKSYYFAGEAIDRSLSAQSQSNNGDIVAAPGLSDLLLSRGAELDRGESGFSVLLQMGAQAKIAQVPVLPPIFEPAVLEQLFPAEVAAWSGSGEFRQVAAVFVGLRGNPSHRELDSVVAVVAQSCELHGGYLNLLDYGDKGYLMLALFGAPTAHENDIERAADFCLAVSKELGEQVRFGLTSGVAYTGLVGSPVRSTYTAMGSTINLSARLMQHAPWGSICSPESLGDRLRQGYHVGTVGSIELKGFDRPVEVVQVESVRLAIGERFLSRFVGRGGELVFLEKRLARAAHGRPGGILYVYGEAGMGKSRLAHEAVKSVGNGTRSCFLETDPILRKSLNPFVEFLSAYFSLPEEQAARKHRFDLGYGQLLRDVDKAPPAEGAAQIRDALERYKPFIGVPLGAHEGGTLYDELDPQARFENTVYGITEFFRALCLLSPLVLVIEDVQAMDHDSTELFAYLLRSLSQLPAAVIITSRFADDGSRPVLHPSDLTNVEELSLGPLSLEAVGELLAERIGGPVDHGTLGMIFEKTQGNPFYAEQFAVYLKETRRLVQ
ncbi:MAG TPA: AAA family ATPase [Spirochaetia bacterium]|nr:AAA family ATPase [Spirochaetia bacterium]